MEKVQASRWFALGRLIGAVEPLHVDPQSDPEKFRKRLNKQLAESGWLKLGRKLGFLYY
jgi:hypothetical protein